MKHLKQEQIVNFLVDAAGCDPALRQHVAVCAECATAADELQSGLESFRDSVHQTAEQRSLGLSGPQIRALAAQRDPGNHSRAWLKWAAMPTLAALLLAAFLFRQEQQTVRIAANDASDEALLMQVQTAVSRGAPAALAPAGLINKERNKRLSSTEKKK